MKIAVAAKLVIPMQSFSLEKALSAPEPLWQANAAIVLFFKFSLFSKINVRSGGVNVPAQTGNPKIISS